VVGPPSWQWLGSDSGLDSVRVLFLLPLILVKNYLGFFVQSRVGSFGGFELDETLGYGKLQIMVNNFMGFSWELLEKKI
jgi:hypothetical protein